MPNPIPRNPLQLKNLVLDLDIDNTLVTSAAMYGYHQLNRGLVDCLKESGLTNINFFSKTTEADIARHLNKENIPDVNLHSFTRIDLVEELKIEGINVVEAFFVSDVLNKETSASAYKGSVTWNQWKDYLNNIKKIDEIIQKLGTPELKSEDLTNLKSTINKTFGMDIDIEDIFNESPLGKEILHHPRIAQISFQLLKEFLKNPNTQLDTTPESIKNLRKSFYTIASQYINSKKYWNLNYFGNVQDKGEKGKEEKDKGAVMEMRLNSLEPNHTPVTFLFADDDDIQLKSVINKIDPTTNATDLTGSTVYENEKLSIVPYKVTEYTTTTRLTFNSAPYIIWIKNGLDQHFEKNKSYIESTLDSLNYPEETNLDVSNIRDNILNPMLDLHNDFASNMPISEYTKYVAVVEAVAETIRNVVATEKDKSKSSKENDTARLKEVIEALEKETTNTSWKKAINLLSYFLDVLLQVKKPLIFKEQRQWFKSLNNAKKLDNSLSK